MPIWPSRTPSTFVRVNVCDEKPAKSGSQWLSYVVKFRPRVTLRSLVALQVFSSLSCFLLPIVGCFVTGICGFTNPAKWWMVLKPSL